MEPKTKLQKEVWNLHEKLKNPKQHEHFMKNKHDTYYTTYYNKLVCFECGNIWKNYLIHSDKNLLKPKCPNCKKKLNIYKKKQNNYYFPEYVIFIQAETLDRFQIFKFYSCIKYFEKGKKPTYSFKSLFEEWIDVYTNKSVIIGRISNGFRNHYGDGFSDSNYEIRGNKSNGYLIYRETQYDRYGSDFNLPKPRFHSEYKKYKLKFPYFNCDLRHLLKAIMNNSKSETVYKAKYGSLLFYSLYKERKILDDYWPQIKIAIRHKYSINNPSLWKDYIDLLSYFNKDINNPKFILPKNLKKEHDILMLKKRKILEEERIKRQFEKEKEERLKAEADEALRGIKEEVFKNICFKENEIKIIPLIKEEDVKFEEEYLNHCVYSSEYHLKSGTLLMSARIDDKPVETIEISLSNFKVIQCRGYDNEPTEHHDFILRILNKNIQKIQKIVDKEKKKLSQLVEV